MLLPKLESTILVIVLQRGTFFYSSAAWHLPLYGPAQLLASQAIAIDWSTLVFWIGYAMFIDFEFRQRYHGSSQVSGAKK